MSADKAIIDDIFIPDYIRGITDAAHAAGFSAFLVGGCLRDALRGMSPHDYDVCITAPSDRLCGIFSAFPCIDTGLRYGTLTVMSDNVPVEVTSCRKESGYSDGRRPDAVSFTSDVREDLARRDFTVNAMAYSEEDGLIDLFGGKSDLANGIIRCVGVPEERFGEDALRILRAVRFAATLGFEIEKSTADAIHKMCRTLSRVSAERCRVELSKLLCGRDAGRILREYSDVICAVIPELLPTVGFPQHNPHHVYTVYEHITRTVDACPADAQLLRCAMLLHDIEKPACLTTDDEGIDHFKGHPALGAKTAEKVLRRLTFSKKDTEDICFLILHHDERPEPDAKSIRRYVSRVGFEGARMLTTIRRADLAAQSPRFADYSAVLDETERLIDELEASEACVSLADLAIGGDDIMALGVPRGRAVGEILNKLLAAVTDERLPNEKSALTAAASRIIEGE